MYITYQITHRASGMIYIGKTSRAIWDKGYMGSGPAIQEAVLHYGVEAFERTILASFATEYEANQDKLNRVTPAFCKNPNTFNKQSGTVGVAGGVNHPLHGTARPDITEMNQKRKGTKQPTTGKTKRVGHWAGKKRPDMTGENHPFFGKPRPQSTKDAQSRALKGKKNPKVGELMAGAGNHQFGVKHSEERKAKTAATRRRNREAKLAMLANPQCRLFVFDLKDTRIEMTRFGIFQTKPSTFNMHGTRDGLANFVVGQDVILPKGYLVDEMRLEQTTVFTIVSTKAVDEFSIVVKATRKLAEIESLFRLSTQEKTVADKVDDILEQVIRTNGGTK